MVKRKCLEVYTQHIAHACSRQSSSPLPPQKKTWIKSQKINEFCGTWHRFTFSRRFFFSAVWLFSLFFLFYVLLLPFGVVVIVAAEPLIILNVSHFHCGIHATSTPVGSLLVFISIAPIIQRQFSIFFFAQQSLDSHTSTFHTTHTHINTQPGNVDFSAVLLGACTQNSCIYSRRPNAMTHTLTYTHRRSRPAFSLCWNVFLSSRVRPRDDTFTSICMRACRQQYKTEVTNNTENENRFVR